MPGTLSAQPAPAAESTDRPLKVVLVGDSFSAGNGARDASGSADYFGPLDCHRCHGNWARQYVDWLTAQGHHVSFVNRACSGGVTADLVGDREMDTSVSTATMPAGVDTLTEATAHLERADPCNTGFYADEEHFSYRATAFDSTVPSSVFYTCTRFLRPQTDAVNADTDLVLFTMGGNDIQFESIVTECFVAGPRDPGDCRDRVNEARTLLPGAMDGVEAAVDQMRASGLRDDARVVYLGYPLLACSPWTTATSSRPGSAWAATPMPSPTRCAPSVGRATPSRSRWWTGSTPATQARSPSWTTSRTPSRSRARRSCDRPQP